MLVSSIVKRDFFIPYVKKGFFSMETLSQESVTGDELVEQNSTPQSIDAPRYTRREILSTMTAVLLVMLLASLDQTIVGTAMPRIITDLHGFDRYTWVTTAYLLTSTVMVPIYGKLSDLFGRKPIFLIGVTLFLVGSAASGAAQTMNQLIAFRAFQGLGAAALMPMSGIDRRRFWHLLDSWSNCWRLDYRSLHMALDFLCKPAHRHYRTAGAHFLDAGVA